MPRAMKQALLLCAGAIVFCAGYVASQPAVPSAPKQNVSSKKTVDLQNPAKADTVASAKNALWPDSARIRPDSSAERDSARLVRSLTVTTDPAGALVFLDDSLKGESPCTINGILPGGHILTMKKKGYYLKKAEIAADSTLPQELAFALLQPGLLKVLSNPSGAEVFIDGKKDGSTPYENDKMKPGDHAVRITLKQFVSLDRTIKTGSGTHDTLQVVLLHTAAYSDSVAAASRAAEKARKNHDALGIVSGIFVLCALILVVVEVANQ
jgi:hypothetical protein